MAQAAGPLSFSSLLLGTSLPRPVNRAAKAIRGAAQDTHHVKQPVYCHQPNATAEKRAKLRACIRYDVLENLLSADSFAVREPISYGKTHKTSPVQVNNQRSATFRNLLAACDNNSHLIESYMVYEEVNRMVKERLLVELRDQDKPGVSRYIINPADYEALLHQREQQSDQAEVFHG